MFLSAQTHFGREEFFHPGILFDITIGKIKNPDILFFLSSFMMLFVLSSFFALILKKKYNEGIFSVAAFYFPLWSLSFVSINRYLLSAFPAFIFFGNLIKNRKIVYLIFFIVLLSLFYFSSLFTRGIFVG